MQQIVPETAPKVSIITPCLNHAAFLEDTLKCVISQDYPNIEYIVVDGGSTDGSLDIIRRHENGITRWISEPDRGQSDAINKGFKMATGEVVAWLNSDDLYFPGAVSRAMARFNADPALDILYGDGVLLTGDGEFLGYIHQVEPFNRERLLSCYNYISQPTTFFRRETLAGLGYLDTGLHYIMDWDLWCRFADGGCRFHYEPHLLAADRQYEATKTRSGGGRRLKEILALSDRFRTTGLPHGYFAYAASHFRGRRRQAENTPDRLRALLGEAASSLLNFRNLYFMYKRPKQVRGLFHGIKGRGSSQAGDRLLAFEAQLKQPLFRRAENLSIGLRPAGNRPLTARVGIAGGPSAEVELAPQQPDAAISLEIPPAVRQSGELTVTFSFGPQRKSQARPEAAAWLTHYSLS